MFFFSRFFVSTWVFFWLQWWFFLLRVLWELFFYFLFFSVHSSSPLGQLIKFAVESKSN